MIELITAVINLVATLLSLLKSSCNTEQARKGIKRGFWPSHWGGFFFSYKCSGHYRRTRPANTIEANVNLATKHKPNSRIDAKTKCGNILALSLKTRTLKLENHAC